MTTSQIEPAEDGWTPPRPLGRLGMLARALLLIVFAVMGLAIFGCVVAFGAATLVWVLLPALLFFVGAMRWTANLHRRWASQLLRAPVDVPYLPLPHGHGLARVRALARDPATWRDLGWLFVNGTAGLVLAVLTIAFFPVGFGWRWLPPEFLRAHASIDRALLSPSQKSRLALRTQQLEESRADIVDTQAAEVRRIERDLHDGAQARLVSLGMSLGLAEEMMDSQPELARELVSEARAASRTALSELRDLVRGIHPPVLADRGLDGAVRALALDSPIPAEVSIDIAHRLPAPVESAAYFAVAESLTNVIKHANAHHVVLQLRLAGDFLSITVSDDGVGGARAGAGTGLRGIERRLASFDGIMTVASPPGGPTLISMEIPCASLSPKTSPSSGTG